MIIALVGSGAARLAASLGVANASQTALPEDEVRRRLFARVAHEGATSGRDAALPQLPSRSSMQAESVRRKQAGSRLEQIVVEPVLWRLMALQRYIKIKV